MRTFKSAMLASLALLALTMPPRASAQEREGDVCETIEARGTENPHRVLEAREIEQCGARVLARLITRSHQVPDPAFWSLVVENSSTADAGVFAAARDLAADRGAAPQARLAGFRIVVIQHFGPGGSILVLDGDDVANVQRPVRCNAVRLAVTGTSYAVATSLPIDADAQIRSLAERIITDPSDARSIRSIATCVRRLFRPTFTPPIDPALLHFSYKCGRLFRVHNDADVPVRVEWDVVGASTTGRLVVPAHGDEFIISAPKLTTRLLYRGSLVQSVANGGVPCQ